LSRYTRYYQRHRDEQLRKSRDYYSKHREQLLEKQRQRRREKHYGAVIKAYEDLIKKSREPIDLTEAEKLVFVAGIVDGEGTITIEKNTNSRFSAGFALHPILTISNTDRKLIEFCKKALKLPHEITRHIKGQRRKDSWRIDVTKKETVLKKLIALRPYLITKSQQADLVMEYCLRRLHTQRGYDKGDLEILAKVRKLNQRGV